MKRYEYKVVIDEWGTGGIIAQTGLNSVTIHHSAVKSLVSDYNAESRAKSYTAWARAKGNPGMQYQFFIPYDKSDFIYCTNYVSGHVWHNSNYLANKDSLSVLVDGNFQEEKPSSIQLQKLEQLLRDLNDNWFSKNGWVSFEKNIVPKNKGAVRTYSENIKVPSLHYHNEVAQAGNATACCGKYLIPYVTDYRNKAGNVSWGVPTGEVDPCEAKIKDAVASTAASYQKIIDAKDKEIASYKKVIVQLEAARDEAEKDLASTKTALELSEERVMKLEGDIKSLTETIKTSSERILALEKKNSELSRKITDLQEELAECMAGKNPGCLGALGKLFSGGEEIN